MKKAKKNDSTDPADKKPGNPSSSVADESSHKKKQIEKLGKNSSDESKQASKTSPAKKDTPVKKRKIKHRSIAITLLFFISMAATGIAAYDFWLLRAQSSVNTQVTNVQDSFETRIGQLEQQLQNTKKQLSIETAARVSAQSEREAINSALQGISERLGRSTVAWHMAEVEYLLTVANHRLTLAQDRKTAIAIFETADSRLKAIADPSLLKVRKKIASEIGALKAVPNIDIPGIAVQIGSLAERADKLPLLDKKRLATATEKKTRVSALDWRELPGAVWNDIKSLVQIRRHQQPTEPLLPPSQAWFLYENLQLKLEQARLAALQQNTALYAQSLDEVSQWLNSYFEVDSAAVGNMLATLKSLREIELRPPIPDVSGSLRELRSVMNDRSVSKAAKE